MIGADRVEQERIQVLNQVLNAGGAASLPSVANYLITLYYQQFLADRQGLDLPDEYEMLSIPFASATGKQLLKPEYHARAGSSVEVELPSGHRHGLSDLSSGEQAMLALMFFVRRLSASGGILCLDEPEQHLHPSLQAAVFELMRQMADRSQILLVSHSASLVAAAPIEALAQVAPAIDTSTNQLRRLADLPDRLQLIAELKLTPADLFQHDMILVVEGDTDVRWLRALFPVEVGRAHVMVAGGSQNVLRAHETLTRLAAGIPWLCICDRLLSDRRAEELRSRYPQLHVWKRREIESMLIDSALIHAVVTSVGISYSKEQVEALLFETATPLFDEVLVQLVEQRVSEQVPPPGKPRPGTSLNEWKGRCATMRRLILRGLMR